MEKTTILILCALGLLIVAGGCTERVSDKLPIGESCDCNVPDAWWSEGRTVVDLVKYCSDQCGFNVTQHNILITLKK